jgi:RNA polymerase sigma-70 factor (sigma-E family)
MGAHEDFDQFVAARWLGLFRVAYLLTADEGAAENLLGSALGRTFARWSAVVAMESPEAHVHRLMVKAVVSQDRRAIRRLEWPRLGVPDGEVPSGDSQVVDRGALWALVCALPEGQRAVLVLRYHEGLTESGTAEVLGCSVGTVRSQTHDALRALRRGVAAMQAGSGRQVTLGSELREALVEQAERRERPAPDPAAIRARGLTLRRRRRRLVAASSMLAALLVVGAGLGVAAGVRQTSGADLLSRSAAGPGVSTGVPWCVPDGDRDGGQAIVGVGAPVRTVCRTDESVALWHHAGTTVLTRHGTTYRVADGRLTPLGHRYGNVVMSHDGRLAAWLDLSSRGTGCRVLPMEIYEVATAAEVATTQVEAESCAHLAGMDDLGRVYVAAAPDRPGVLDVRMFDTRTREWRQVLDVPTPSRYGVITYVTADGFAVQIAEHTTSLPYPDATRPLASLEGRVDPAGRFVPRREVPIGRGRWSPDRSLVVDQQPEGVVVRSADLTRKLALELPPDLFAAQESRLPEADLIWESPTSVLAVSGLEAGSPVYRCDVRSGSCERVDRLGQPALGNGAQPEG